MTNHASHYVFVYGSLRRGFQSPAYEYISRYFNFFGDARVKGKLFDLGEYPGGVPTQEDSFITGELYIVKEDGEFIRLPVMCLCVFFSLGLPEMIKQRHLAGLRG